MRKTFCSAVTTATFLVMAACAHAADAVGPKAPGASVWRCGNRYSDQPCAGGRAVDVQDRPSSADSRAQDARTRDIQRQADAMARERRILEAQAAGRRPAVIAPPPPAPTAQAPAREPHASRPRTRKAKKHARGESGTFTARTPKAEPAARKPGKKRA